MFKKIAMISSVFIFLILVMVSPVMAMPISRTDYMSLWVGKSHSLQSGQTGLETGLSFAITDNIILGLSGIGGIDTGPSGIQPNGYELVFFIPSHFINEDSFLNAENCYIELHYDYNNTNIYSLGFGICPPVAERLYFAYEAGFYFDNKATFFFIGQITYYFNDYIGAYIRLRGDGGGTDSLVTIGCAFGY